MKYILNRLKEPSTWRGLTLFITASGISISPEAMEYIVSFGVGLSGLIGIITTDYIK
ncbi:MAG: hypothetical protein HQL71_09855 [Magnetococcales bacterium]|nr:hypothetical protein [Magnetococcales bacterium]